jgi:hypothetical protein
MGSEKSADHAWDFLSSWFVIGVRFYRAASGSPETDGESKCSACMAQLRRDPVDRDEDAALHALVGHAFATTTDQLNLQGCQFPLTSC